MSSALAERATARFEIEALTLDQLLEQRRHHSQSRGRHFDVAKLLLREPLPAADRKIVDELTDLREREAGVLRQLDDGQLRHGVVIEHAAAAHAPRGAQQLLFLVVADRRRRDARPFCKSRREELPNGYALTLDRSQLPLNELAEWVSFEARCCPFLDFQISFAGASGPLTLQLTGKSAEVKAFLAQEIRAFQSM